MKNKTSIAFFLVGMLLGLPQFVLASEHHQEQISAWRLETQGWSINDHVVAAKAQEEKVQSPENRIQHLDTRTAHFENKPHFDPKGIHRNGLKLISSTLKGKINLLNEKVAWHYRQSDQAKLMELCGIIQNLWF